MNEMFFFSIELVQFARLFEIMKKGGVFCQARNVMELERQKHEMLAADDHLRAQLAVLKQQREKEKRWRNGPFLFEEEENPTF